MLKIVFLELLSLPSVPRVFLRHSPLFRSSPELLRRSLPPARPTSPENLTRAEVESLAESSKAGQRLIDMENSMFGGNMSLPTTLLLGLACVAMFVENNRRRTAKEDLEEQHELGQLEEVVGPALRGAEGAVPDQLLELLADLGEPLEPALQLRQDELLHARVPVAARGVGGVVVAEAAEAEPLVLQLLVPLPVRVQGADGELVLSRWYRVEVCARRALAALPSSARAALPETGCSSPPPSGTTAGGGGLSTTAQV